MITLYQPRKLVDHCGSDLPLIACAGPGKTESTSRRATALVVEGDAPASVAAFTFAERAAQELKEWNVRRVGATSVTMHVGKIHNCQSRIPPGEDSSLKRASDGGRCRRYQHRQRLQSNTDPTA